MKGTKVPIKEDLVLQLHQIGKTGDVSLAALVDQLIREGLELRRDREAIAAGGGSADCSF